MSISADGVGIIILAAGRSARFGETNKLGAALNGRPLAAYAAMTAADTPADRRLAVLPPTSQPIAEIFHRAGIEVFENTDPSAGQGDSLALGIRELSDDPCIQVIFVLLADMPNVRPAHLTALSRAIGRTDIAIAESQGRLSPPALFHRRTFHALGQLTGDQGARALLPQFEVTKVAFASESLIDIDTTEDLQRATDLRSRQNVLGN